MDFINHSIINKDIAKELEYFKEQLSNYETKIGALEQDIKETCVIPKETMDKIYQLEENMHFSFSLTKLDP